MHESLNAPLSITHPAKNGYRPKIELARSQSACLLTQTHSAVTVMNRR